MSVDGTDNSQSAPSSCDLGSSHVARPLSRPRPRPVLSCLRCRSRKIKCDRLLPCKQCKLTGHDQLCSYNLRPKTGSSGPDSHSGSVSIPLLTDPSQTDADVRNFSQQALVCNTRPEGSLGNAETLLSLQQRLLNLERLYENHSSTRPGNTSGDGREDNRAETKRRLPEVDAALSIKMCGPRYHSESYKKSLHHHVSLIFSGWLSDF
jgi:hypothetical protein